MAGLGPSCTRRRSEGMCDHDSAKNVATTTDSLPSRVRGCWRFVCTPRSQDLPLSWSATRMSTVWHLLEGGERRSVSALLACSQPERASTVPGKKDAQKPCTCAIRKTILAAGQVSMSRDPDMTLGAIFALVLKGEQQECLRLLKTLSSNELHELRYTVSQLRDLTVDAARTSRGNQST